MAAEVREQVSPFESMAVRAISRLRIVKEELKETNDELKTMLSEDAEYGKLEKEIADLKEKQKRAKDRVLQEEEVAAVAGKVKDLRDDAKELKQTISDNLGEYMRATGKKTINDEGGTQLTIFDSYAVK